ncbi:MbtH protein [Serratia fonticola]|jgi:MbtH protein|uniref:MbtH protein n=1 Tax=Serratia fonticola TaxID=47917 RepID=A0A559T8J0_SERFO|nr:MbtH family NRPS accessory protein [Serratia fonticola]TQI81552.1 MbtH protein [Serratia fonticola]TQI96424.1 MbtH protein [Serratia fonticola]TVZ70921.1 MbtH protein [Serratia fonticola]
MEFLNPFDDDQQACYILRNDEQLYSLWPDFSAIPLGWACVFGPASREQCVNWLEQYWQDMRPASQRKA